MLRISTSRKIENPPPKHYNLFFSLSFLISFLGNSNFLSFFASLIFSPNSLSSMQTRKMPPRPAQTKLPTKTSSKPSIHVSNPKISDSTSLSNHPNPPRLDLSDSNELEIANRGAPNFDLNEPWCVAHEDANEEKERSEIGIRNRREVFEVRRGSEEVPVREKRKQKEFEVFVGGLDRDAVEEDLENVFRKVGEIVEVRLVKDRYSQRNKGFAFVRFATVEQAKRAAYELNYTQIRGKVCEVTRNNDNETLHLGNICPTWTKDMLVDKLRPYELENLEEILLIEDPKDRTKNRGYAFLNFGTHMDAVAACHRLQKGNIYFGTTARAEVAFAKSAVEPDEEIMAQVKSVFLDGLPPSWDEEHVHEQFKMFGKIENIELARNMPSAKRMDFGFITFKTREAALSCIDVVNKDGIGEGSQSQKVILRASLRKPLQKRMQSTVGSWRGYSGNSYDDWGSRSRRMDRSYSDRPRRTVESFDRDSNRDFSGYHRYSTRRVAVETESFPVEKYGSQFRRASFQQGSAAAAGRSRSRDPYSETSSYSRHSLKSSRDFSTSYTRVSSREQYDDDIIYEPPYEYYENVSPDAYDYPAPSRLKRPYSAVDDEELVSSSVARRARSGEYALATDAYPVHDISSYEEYSRNSPDYYDYGSTVYATRYMSGSGASGSYHY